MRCRIKQTALTCNNAANRIFWLTCHLMCKRCMYINNMFLKRNSNKTVWSMIALIRQNMFWSVIAAQIIRPLTRWHTHSTHTHIRLLILYALRTHFIYSFKHYQWWYDWWCFKFNNVNNRLSSLNADCSKENWIKQRHALSAVL